VPRRNDDRRKKQRCDNCDRHHDDRPKSSRATQFRRRDQITPYATDQTFCLKLSTLHIYVFNTIFSTAFLQLLFLRSFSMFNISVFKILHSFSIMQYLKDILHSTRQLANVLTRGTQKRL
jgi:hypothetical protein